MTDEQTRLNGRAGDGAMSRRAFLTRAMALGVAAAAGSTLPWSAAAAASAADDDLFLIGLEEHYAAPELLRLNGIKLPNPKFIEVITDVAAGRIAAMDEAGIGMQVLSAMTPGAQELPGAEGVDFARAINAWIAREVIPAYPDRFRAFAALPMREPQAAADELERAVRDDGLVGCMTYGAIGGRFLDDAAFEPVLARAEALGAPVYIHPASPSPEIMDLYYSGLGDDWVSKILGGPGYGWHQEVALQCLRMIVSGVFDKFPDLQVIVGHMGEGLPFYYWRFGGDLAKATKRRLKKPVQQYLHDNFWMTTSAFFREELLTLLLSVMGEDRVMFAVDYPFAGNKAGADWLRSLDLPRPTKEKIAHGNARKLLGLGPG